MGKVAPKEKQPMEEEVVVAEAPQVQEENIDFLDKLDKAAPLDPAKKPEEPAKKPEEPAKKPEDPAKKPEEPAKKTEEPAKKPEEPAKKPEEEPEKKPEEPEKKKPGKAKFEFKPLDAPKGMKTKTIGFGQPKDDDKKPADEPAADESKPGKSPFTLLP